MKKNNILNNNLLITLLLLIALLCTNYLYGQDYDVVQEFTPQSSDLGKVAIGEQSLYVGQPNINIDVYTLKYFDITVPISLHYDASGFRPEKPSSWVGLNWSLSAGGFVSRKVNGVPDERPSNDTQARFHGFMYKDKVFSNEDILNFSAEIIDTSASVPWKINYELSPDIFTFQLPNGQSGKFMLNNNYVNGQDGGITVFGNQQFKIDLDINRNRLFDDESMKTIYDGKITITSDNGTIYIFGGSYKPCEYSWTYGGEKYPNLSDCTLDTWKLKKIISPTGHQVIFNYMETSELHGKPFHSDYIFMIHKESSGSRSISRVSYLKNIQCDNQTINFYTSLKSTSWGDNDIGNEKLDSIVVRDHNNNVLVKYRFLIQHDGRYLLKEFNKVGEPKYYFSYINGSVPSGLTPSIDFWGFYNSNNNSDFGLPLNANGFFYKPNLKIKDTYNYVYSRRKPDFNRTTRLILNEIQYPTGAKVNYEYEQNDYFKTYWVMGMYYGVHPKDEVNNKTAGLRIKKIIIKENDDKKIEKHYKYVLDYQTNHNTNISSGILNAEPNQYFATPTTGFLSGIASGSPITYSEVVELGNLNGANNGYKIYKYASHETNPDESVASYIDSYFSVYAGGMVNAWVRLIDPPGADFGSPETRFGKHSSLELERGKLVSLRYYNNNDIITHKEDYVYNISSTRKENFVAAMFFPNRLKYLFFIDQDLLIPLHFKNYLFLTTYKTYTFGNKLTKKTITDYKNGTPTVVTTTNYFYNDQQFLANESFYNSNGEIVESKYKYVKELDDLQNPSISKTANDVLDAMVQKNMLNLPLITETFIDNERISGNITAYYKPDNSNIFAPAAQWTLEKEGVEYVNNHTLFDKEGKIIQYLPKNGSYISYIWAFKNQYPVVKAVNATYEELNNWLNMLQPDMDAFLESLGDLSSEQARIDWATFNETLRGLLPNAQITTYTYIPLVGMSSKCDINGNATYYQYDNLNRLETIRDNDYNIIKHIDYHYNSNN